LEAVHIVLTSISSRQRSANSGHETNYRAADPYATDDEPNPRLN